MAFVSGLDLGQTTDYSALIVAERTVANGGPVYAVRHLECWPLGTPYTAVVGRVTTMFTGPPLAGTVLAVDQSGVGRPVVEQLAARRVDARLLPVTITAGRRVTRRADGWRVPKRELIGALNAVVAGRRLTFTRGLPLADTLAEELRDFAVQVTAAANETFAAPAGRQDDLVLALALAVWAGEPPRG